MAAHVPTAAIPATLPKTYSELYADANSDPWNGNYGPVMRTFRDDNNPLSSTDMFAAAKSMGTDTPNAYIGLFAYENEECGRSMVLHAISTYPTVLGRTTNWDNKTYASVQDVDDGDITSIEIGNGIFERTRAATSVNVPGTLVRVDELLLAEPDNELIGPFQATDVNIVQRRTRIVMSLPPKYIPLVVNRRLTPKQIWTDLVGAIRADGNVEDCQELVNWAMLALTRHAATQPSATLQQLPVAPLADSLLNRHRRQVLFRQLPGADPRNTPASAVVPTQLVNLVSQLVNNQRTAREEDTKRADTASAERLPSLYWGAAATARLCMLCNVTDEADLPELWLRLAAAGAKKDRITIDAVLMEIAVAEDAVELLPIVTPALAKVFTSMRLAGDDIDDLSDGLQPFALSIQDFGCALGEAAASTARDVAMDYDQLMAGSMSTDLNDVRSLRTATKVTIPRQYPQTKAKIQAMRLMVIATFGALHPLNLSYKRFVTKYLNRESYYNNRLENLALPHAPAQFLRYNQLQLTNWLRDMRSHHSGPMVPVPNFSAIFDKLAMTEQGWAPMIPLRYTRTPSVPKVPVTGTSALVAPGAGGGGGGGADPPAERNSQVTNHHKNPEFDQFSVQLGKIKLNAAIEKGGYPPKVKRQDPKTKKMVELSMCGSWHLRGTCMSLCGRRLDHGPHSAEEDVELIEWCQKALA